VDLKQDAGGIVDIEFSVQYLVLKHACEQPSLYEFTDNIRILDALEKASYLSAETAESLRECYKTYRSIGHRQSLEERKGLVSEDEIAEMRETVTGSWEEIFSS
jgi:glutamate-ammonia-ligase adenylyltransferase